MPSKKKKTNIVKNRKNRRISLTTLLISLQVAGPVWLGELHDKAFVSNVLHHVDNKTDGR